MSEHSRSCVLCKSSDNLATEDNLIICTVCGVVVDEELFESDDNAKEFVQINSNDFCNLRKHTNLMKRELVNRDLQTNSKKQAKQMLDHCMGQFRFSSTMKEDANRSLIQLINSKHFYMCFSTTKIILAGVCAYLVMIKFDYVITKNAVAKAVGCSVYEFGTIYKRAMKHTNVSKPKHFTIDQHITNTVNSLPFDQTELPQIENLVTELINFQRSCCLVDSNFPLNVILAASFYAWKCVKIEERSKVNLKAFLTKFNIKCNLNKYVSKLIAFLIDLCRLIPWITDKKRINKKTVYFFTQDLVDYPVSIVTDYLKLKNEAIDQRIAEQQTSTEMNCKRERDVFEWNDELNDDKDEISLANISDSEIDSYIRTKEEVRVLKKIKKNHLHINR